MKLLLAWLRAGFWRVVGPPPVSESGPSFFRASPVDLMAQAEALQHIARTYEQRTGRPLFGGRELMRLLRTIGAWLRRGYWLVASPPRPPAPPAPKEPTGDDDVILRLRLSADQVSGRRRPVKRHWN